MPEQLQLPSYEPSDFQTAAPYEYINGIRDPFQRQLAVDALSKLAKDYRVVGFMKKLQEYLKSLRSNRDAVYVNSVTAFQGQPIELAAGEWECSESGIVRHTSFGDEVACSHPIIPVERYRNVDTGVIKVKLWWRVGNWTQTFITDKKTIATASSIVGLADHGVSVSSETAKPLVRWLQEVEALNHGAIPEKQSVGRLGWIETTDADEPLKFSPYAGTLEFDGDENFRSFFQAVSPHGTYKEWLAMAHEVRKNGITARVVLAASFASALVKLVGLKPFFVHLWGGAGNGKTLSLMLAASVWADPEMGRYIHSFNSTAVGQEMSAGFVNSLPLILDELQVVKNKQDFDETIYKLTEGFGRLRSNVRMGVSQTKTWANCIITTGEMPITTGSSGDGAIDRVINVECKDELFPARADAPNFSPRLIAQFIRKNYGHAGKRFIAALMRDGFDKVTELHNKFTRQLEKTDATPRQSLAAALILTADALANEYLFNDNNSLTVGDMVEFLATKSAVDVNERGYQYMRGWVAQNAHKLTKDSVEGRECWGDLVTGDYRQPDTAFIERQKFNDAVAAGGFNPTALLSWCNQKSLIKMDGRHYDVWKPINKVRTRCVALTLPGGSEHGDFVEMEDEQGELPF